MGRDTGRQWLVRRGAAYVLLALFFVGLYAFGSQRSARAQTQPDAELQAQLQEVLAPSTTDTGNLRMIDSSLGFKLTYNKMMLEGQGQVTDAAPTDSRFTVTGTTYADDELDERRDYSLVKFRPIETEEREIGYYPSELTVLTNIRAGYWDNRVNLPEYAGKSKLDIWIAETTKSKQRDGYEAGTPQDRQINGVGYKEVVYTLVTDDDVPYKTTDKYYFTVQNDRPYYAAIYGIQDGDELVAEYESIIKSIAYEGLETDKLALGPHTRVLAAQDGLSDTSNVPQGFSTEGLLDVVAKNQIAVVRVGAVNCMDLDLVLPDGTVSGTISDACAAGVGSGSIVTSDGYVATNGHVVRAGKLDALAVYLSLSATVDELADRARPILSFFVAKGELTEQQSDLFLSKVRARDSFAVQRALGLGSLLTDEEVTARNEASGYAVQLSDDPLRLDMSSARLAFAYSDTIVPATLVGDSFEGLGEGGKVDFYTLKGTDVAILKMDGSYPLVDLGNILNIRKSDRLTAIGYPAFIDGGIQTTKERTVPSITQGYVEAVEPQIADSQYKLIITSVPIAQGNSGGPSFDDSGVQIGLNTYSILPCQDGQCFGNGIIRDIDDLKQLAAVKGVQFGKAGSITDDWRQGVSALKAADYVAAAKRFNKVATKYHNHYLAVAMRSLAETKAGGPIDYSETPVFLIAGISIGTVVLLAVGLTIIVGARRHHRKTELASAAMHPLSPIPMPAATSTPAIPQALSQSQAVATPQAAAVPPAPPVQPATAFPAQVSPSTPVVVPPATQMPQQPAPVAPQTGGPSVIKPTITDASQTDKQ